MIFFKARVCNGENVNHLYCNGLIRGRNNGHILPFVRPEFSVVTEITSHFFLE